MLRKILLSIVVFVGLNLLIAACAPQTIEVTRIIEREAEPVEVEVTRVVEGEAVEVEVTRIVEETVEEVVEVTPTPIGGELILYACLFEPDRLEE